MMIEPFSERIRRMLRNLRCRFSHRHYYRRTPIHHSQSYCCLKCGRLWMVDDI